MAQNGICRFAQLRCQAPARRRTYVEDRRDGRFCKPAIVVYVALAVRTRSTLRVRRVRWWGKEKADTSATFTDRANSSLRRGRADRPHGSGCCTLTYPYGVFQLFQRLSLLPWANKERQLPNRGQLPRRLRRR